MSIRSVLSSIATGAVLLGLTGIPSPAFAAAPTVTIDLAGSGCESTTPLLFNDLEASEFFAQAWEDGNSAGISTTATCDGMDYDVRWEEIALPDGEAVVLTVPDMSGVEFVEVNGTIDSAWGSECLNTSYAVGTSVSISTSVWGSVSRPNISYLGMDYPDIDGDFSISFPAGYAVWASYPLQDEVNGQYFGAPDAETGVAFATKCRAEPAGETVAETGGVISLINNTTRFTYELDYPEGFDSSECTLSANEYEFMWRGMNSATGNLECPSYRINLEEKVVGVVRGQTTNVVFEVPSLNLVTISGTVEFTQDICETQSLSVYNGGGGWDWEANGSDSSIIAADGSFSFEMPAGNAYIFASDGEPSDAIDGSFVNSACSITNGNLGYVGQDLSGLELVGDFIAVDVTIEQPDVNEPGTDCALYDEGDLEMAFASNPENRTFAVARAASQTTIQLHCGDFERSLLIPFTMTGADTATATVEIPDIKMKTITGSLKLPAGYPASRYRDLELFVEPLYDHDTGATGGWQQMSSYDYSINAAKGKYTVTVPEGSYTFAVGSRATPKNGCYARTYYPSTTIHFAQPVGITSSTVRAPGLQLLVGGSIRGHATFADDIESTVTNFEDQIFNIDGVPLVSFAGDMTGVDEDGDFHVYQCLTPGQYFYRAGNSGDGVKSEFYDNVTSIANAKPITIPEGGGDSKVFEMAFDAADNGTISGTVLDDEDEPLIGYQVVAYDPETETFRTDETDSGGNYAISGLDLPGSYEVFAFGSGFWYGGNSSDYAFFPSTDQAGAVEIKLTNSRSIREEIGIVVDGSETAVSFLTLYPWYRNMSIQAPADNFDGVADAVESGDIALDEANVQIVPDNRQRTGAPLADWELDLDVNFNSILDSTVGAYGFSNGAAAAELGEVGAVEDVAHIRGEMDLNEGLNFVTVTGSESGDSVAVPIVFGALAPTQLTDPEMSGVLKVGKTVKSTAGFWLASPSITKKSYQWMTCSSSSTVTGCKAIAGQKALKIKLPATAKRKYLALKVTATNGTTSTVEVHSFGRVQ